jgi:hypothetical protein
MAMQELPMVRTISTSFINMAVARQLLSM